jgi:hypothetical protein
MFRSSLFVWKIILRAIYVAQIAAATVLGCAQRYEYHFYIHKMHFYCVIVLFL